MEPNVIHRWRVPECTSSATPCVVFGCRYHLACEWRHGSEPQPADYPDCALDVAALGGCSLAALGGLLGVSKEAARQAEEKALVRLTRRMAEH